MDLRNFVLDYISLNGQTLRNVLENETAYERLVNYPVQVDLKDNTLLITIQQDSVLYNSVKDGFKVNFATGLVFEYDNKLTGDYEFEYLNGEFVAKTLIRDIVVSTNKTQYYEGQDLDLTKFVAYCVNMDGTKGEDIVLTTEMISGYDKNTAGKQTVTFTYEGKTATVEITVVKGIERRDHDSENAGCMGSVTSVSSIFVALGLLITTAILLKKKRNNCD